MTLTRGIGNLAEIKEILIKEYPYIAYCFNFIVVVEVDEIETACTNGSDIFVNREYLDSLSPRECVAVMAHETLHVAFEHIRRFKEFEDKKIWMDRIGTWNLACDVWINFILYRNNLAEIINVGIDYRDYNIKTTKLADMSVEEVYTLFLERGITFETSDLDIEYPTYSGVNWRDIRNEANKFQYASGNEMYGLSESDKGLWRRAITEILDNYIKEKTTSDYSKLNRRFPEGIFGTVIPGKKKENKMEDEDVVVVLDISGSMVSNILTEEDVNFVVSEIEKRGIKVNLLFHDEEVYNKEQTGSKKSTFFKPVIEYIRDKYKNPIIIWRTDGNYQDNPVFPKSFRFIWLLTRRIKDKKLPGKHFII